MYTKDFHGLSLEAAEYELDLAIKTARRDKDKLLCLIVGHGASGKTHKIKTRFIELLALLEEKNQIKGFIKGEDLNIFSKAYQSFKFTNRVYPIINNGHPNQGEIYVVL